MHTLPLDGQPLTWQRQLVDYGWFLSLPSQHCDNHPKTEPSFEQLIGGLGTLDHEPDEGVCAAGPWLSIPAPKNVLQLELKCQETGERRTEEASDTTVAETLKGPP